MLPTAYSNYWLSPTAVDIYSIQSNGSKAKQLVCPNNISWTTTIKPREINATIKNLLTILTILTHSPDLCAWTSNVKLTKQFCKSCSGGKQDRTSSADDWTNRWCVNNVRGLMGTSESVSVWFDASNPLSVTQSDLLDAEDWTKLLFLMIKLMKELTEC